MTHLSKELLPTQSNSLPLYLSLFPPLIFLFQDLHLYTLMHPLLLLIQRHSVSKTLPPLIFSLQTLTVTHSPIISSSFCIPPHEHSLNTLKQHMVPSPYLATHRNKRHVWHRGGRIHQRSEVIWNTDVPCSSLAAVHMMSLQTLK